MNRALHPSLRQTVSSNSKTQLLIYLVKELSGCQNQTKIHLMYLCLVSMMTTETTLMVAKPQCGGATRDRTADLLNANQALSQLSYSPN